MIRLGELEFGDLRQVQDWLSWNDPNEDIVIYVSGVNRARGVSWRYGKPGQQITFKGPGVLDGFGSKSWCVSWQSDANGLWEDVVIQGYVRGGISVNRGHVQCVGMTFRDLGTVVSRPAQHSKHGLAGVMFGAASTGSVRDCVFADVVNVWCPWKRTCPGSVHAVYVRGGNVTVAGNSFIRVSGDPVFLRDGAVADVYGNTGERAGVNAMIGTYGVDPVTAVWLGENVPTTLFNGKRSVESEVV